MSEVSGWAVLAKSSVGSTHYVAVTDKLRFLLSSVFPTMATTGTGSEALYVSVSNQNQLNFKGIKSGDTGLLTVATATNNIVLTVLESGIDLALCNNATSGFLKSVGLTADVSGTLPVTNGGTGLATIAKGQVLYASAADTIAGTTAMSTHGQLMIGNGTTGIPSITTLASADGSVTITNGAGTIDLSATLATLTANLSTGTFNLNLDVASGASWLTGDGADEGISIDATGYVFIGDSTPTLPSLAAQLTLGGNHATAIAFGNTSNYKDMQLKAVTAPAATTGMALTMEAAAGGTGNFSGGAITIQGGDASGTGTGGVATLRGGDPGASGTAGEVALQTDGTAGLKVDKDQNVNLPAGYIRFSQTAQTLSGAGAVDITSQITHVATTGANALTLADGVNGQTKVITMTVDAGDGTLTPSNLAGGSTITFNDVGDTVHLLFTNSNWIITGNHGSTVA
jgi:hypothetical protein